MPDVGARVVVHLENPDRTVGGLVKEFRPSGVRVRLDGEQRDRTVAKWRISAAAFEGAIPTDAAGLRAKEQHRER